MTDIPTRLRSDAQSVDRLGRVLSATGDDLEGPRLRERAGLMRAAADEIERLSEALEAAAHWHDSERKALGKQPPNTDRDWRRAQHALQAEEIRSALVSEEGAAR
ncbi:hypothetical protein [Methylobacterium sp. yr596]|uniref:hypothetical protein n=1 Tax=Methylobacterium sp. yr596 TaxID=1761800 RepID=UPI001113B01D|nr:hypothetical protein [Methylobacterium sp. yr596]